jgi:predicted Rossmann fold flavoprotein
MPIKIKGGFTLNHDLIIIGGGASGIISAIMAKDFGLDVAIVEANNRIGKKILTTGNGRCNISNKNININRYHSENTDFVYNFLENFSLKDTEIFFNSLGINFVELEEGKLYPLSLQASSVLDIFLLALEERQIPVYLNSKVTSIKKLENNFNITTSSDIEILSKSVILSTGGNSAPNTGSDGSGYLLAKSLGHTVIAPVPALVQLKLDYSRLKSISGVKFEGKATITINDQKIKSEFGELLFTDYGISGPPILQLSRIAAKSLQNKAKVEIKIDTMPDKSYDELKIMLENHWGTFSYRSLYNSFIGIVHKKIIPVLLKESQVLDIHKPCWEISWDEKENILNNLKNWSFKVTDTNGFKNSQVTAGGINTLEINSNTLESNLLPGLYFAGEILDVDGDCGGFNLQWAWSSAAVAVKNILKYK